MRRFGFAGLLLVFAAAAAMADAGDPPARVGRLNYLSGAVSFRPASVEDWTAATLNYPLTTGDHLWTDEGAQTEIHVGSTAVRMGPQTAISFINLDDRIVQISVTQGELNVHIRYLGENESLEIDTPNSAISLLRSGDYRIHADGDNSVTIVNVRGGEAEVTAGGSAFPVRSSQSARLTGMDNPSQEISAALPPDGFDNWCEGRERREAAPVSARYVPREMVGYEDLDEYGVWTEVPPYGWVWRPRSVVAGWAPYHYGHWAWVEPWGWTWIDDAPWGFAPFHYGRWAYAGGLWVWVPGRMAPVGMAVVRPVYAPALVAFVGGPHFSLAVGVGGGVGMAAWFPLGPGEVYRPAYHVSPTYVQNVNIVHVTNVTVINNVNVTNVRYVNQNVNGAVTAVPQTTFTSARPVAQASLRVPPGAMTQAQVVGATAPIAPQRQSILANASTGTVHAPPARFVDRQVVARTPPPPAPVPFAAKQQALQANGGRPLAPDQLNNIRATEPPPRGPMVRTFGQPAAQPQNQPRTFGRPAGNPAGQPEPQNAPRTFGRPAQNEQPNQRPPMNDRPASARPSYSPAPANNDARPSSPRPNYNPAPANNEARPAAQQPRPSAAETPRSAPTEQHQQDRRNDRPGRGPRKEERSEKKDK